MSFHMCVIHVCIDEFVRYTHEFMRYTREFVRITHEFLRYTHEFMRITHLYVCNDEFFMLFRTCVIRMCVMTNSLCPFICV